ncbi:hypothetical protein [Thaumasiovibrio sp. DFM-14]|uniref:hypothetical protein n=1 Tax=Thaumasiovibrio sp. DFM-14 TaxID=3384792 RepID=UPI0039A06791
MFAFHRLLPVMTLLIGTALSSASTAQGFAIVTATPPPPTDISEAKARRVFSGKSRTIDGMGKIKLVDLPVGSPLRIEFYQRFLNKTEAQMSRQWASLAFSGKAQPPFEMPNEDIEQLKEWLINNPNAIGYIPIDAAGGLNVLYEVR